MSSMLRPAQSRWRTPDIVICWNSLSLAAVSATSMVPTVPPYTTRLPWT